MEGLIDVMKKGFGETAAIKELVLSSMPKIISNTASNAGNFKFAKAEVRLSAYCFVDSTNSLFQRLQLAPFPVDRLCILPICVLCAIMSASSTAPICTFISCAAIPTALIWLSLLGDAAHPYGQVVASESSVPCSAVQCSKSGGLRVEVRVLCRMKSAKNW